MLKFKANYKLTNKVTDIYELEVEYAKNEEPFLFIKAGKGVYQRIKQADLQPIPNQLVEKVKA